MSFGKKKSKKVEIKAPPRITHVETRTPLGDRFTTRTSGRRQISEARLSPFSRGLLNQSQEGIRRELAGLERPDPRRVEDIRQRARDLFDQSARTIHQEADRLRDHARVSLSRRFGDSRNATFGNDLLSRLDDNRLDQLAGARQRASLLAEELGRSDENDRLRRLGVFAGFINDLTRQASGQSAVATSLLSQETRRANDLAIRRARLLEDSLQRREALGIGRLGLVNGLVSSARTLI